MTRLCELDYRPDSALRFQSLLDLPHCVFLDSSHGTDFAGRYDILAASPYMTLTTRGQTTEIRRAGRCDVSTADPLALVNECLGPPTEPNAELPFIGGAIGYFAYDLGRRFERFGGTAVRDIELPEMIVGIYDWAIVVDHAAERSWIVGAGRDPSTFTRWDALVARARQDGRWVRAVERRPRPPFEVLSGVRSNLDRDAYASAFATVKRQIRSGNCYQINLTQRFEARVRGDSWQAYLQLRRSNPAPYSAYLGLPEAEVLCSSPERFLRVDDGRVETKPIKGTRPRSASVELDRRMAVELAASAKDRAENVMIVDLLRNDLGRSCTAGSVRAGPLFEIESFANVHHLVSTITGALRPDRHALDLLRNCFPGGSITGAPKLAAMQIIDELEPQRRSVYCGAIGYIGFDGRMDTNITIRTLLRIGDSIYTWAGGGIVADSKLEDEYQESFDKAAALLAILAPEAPAVVG